MDIFECSSCNHFTPVKNNTYGNCSKLKDWVLPWNTFCEADGIIDPNNWFMKEPFLSMYLKQEIKYKCKILPKHMDRSKYKIKEIK